MTGIALLPLESPLGPLAPAHLSEFIVGLVLAIAVALGVQKFVVPRFEAMYQQRAAEIEGGINHAQQVKAEAAQMKAQYQEQLASSREDAARLREEARAQGVTILAEARAQAQAETERMLERAREQIQVERDQAFTELRSEIGVMATDLAERIVGESLDPASTSRTVDRFLSELASQPSRTVPDYVPGGLAGSEQ